MATFRKELLTWRSGWLAPLAVAAALAAVIGYSVYRKVTVVIPHSYAAWTTGDLLVEYLETHNDQWPRGWADLRQARDSLVRKGRNLYWDFDKLPGVVKVDWNVEPMVLARSAEEDGESGIRVVTQLDGSRLEAKWGTDTEPNRKVAGYLAHRYSSTNQAPIQGTPR